jgi:hypothetical protein
VVFARGAPFLVALSGEVEVLDDGATLRMTRGKPLLLVLFHKPKPASFKSNRVCGVQTCGVRSVAARGCGWARSGPA